MHAASASPGASLKTSPLIEEDDDDDDDNGAILGERLKGVFMLVCGAHVRVALCCITLQYIVCTCSYTNIVYSYMNGVVLCGERKPSQCH